MHDDAIMLRKGTIYGNMDLSSTTVVVHSAEYLTIAAGHYDKYQRCLFQILKRRTRYYCGVVLLARAP